MVRGLLNSLKYHTVNSRMMSLTVQKKDENASYIMTSWHGNASVRALDEGNPPVAEAEFWCCMCASTWNAVEQTVDISVIHYSDVIMDTMASQITSLTIGYSSVYSGADQRKHQSSASLELCAGNSLVTGEFPAQRANNAENVSIWWCHYVRHLSPHMPAVVSGETQLSTWKMWPSVFWELIVKKSQMCVHGTNLQIQHWKIIRKHAFTISR